MASSRLTMAHGAVAAPLCMMARWKRSLDRADSKCSETETAPALSPNKVMRFGSDQKRKFVIYGKYLNFKDFCFSSYLLQNVGYYLEPNAMPYFDQTIPRSQVHRAFQDIGTPSLPHDTESKQR